MKNKKGFTLVELLAVIVILGVLTAIAVPSVIGISKKIKQNMWESKVKTIEVAAELWADDNKSVCSEKIETLTIQELISGNYLKADDNNGNFDDPTGKIENLKSLLIKDIEGIKIKCADNPLLVKDFESYKNAVLKEIDKEKFTEIKDYYQNTNFDENTNENDCKRTVQWVNGMSLSCAYSACTKLGNKGCSSLSESQFNKAGATGAYDQYRISKNMYNDTLLIYRANYNVDIDIYLDGRFYKNVKKETDNDTATDGISYIGARGYQIVNRDPGCSNVGYDEENDELTWTTSSTLKEDIDGAIWMEKH